MRVNMQFAAILLTLMSVSTSGAQEQKAANPAAAPPNVVLLVHQETSAGKASERQKLESNLSRASDRLEAPSYWIDLQSFTGYQEALFLDPFESFDHLGQSKAEWNQFLTAHPDLAETQSEIDSLILSEHMIVAVRRDDLGYLWDSIDLSEARYMRVLEVRAFPGHESDFVEASKILADACTKTQLNTPWVVYQVDVGAPAPTFIVFMPMADLKRNDDLLSLKQNLLEAASEQGAETLKRIARESFASTESNLYAVSPEMSHVSKDFAAADPDFWKPKTAPEQKPDVKPKPKTSVTR